MVPLDEGAAHLELWLKADAQDLGRFAPRPTSLRSLVGLNAAPVSPISYYSIPLKKPPQGRLF